MIKLMVSDWDGVFTSVKYHNQFSQIELKTYKDIDMTAIKCFQSMGVTFVVLSGDPWNEGVCKSRGIPFFNSRNSDGILDKGEIIKSIMVTYGVTSEETAYVGDDLFDIGALETVKFAFCPSDSSQAVLKYVNSQHKGYSAILSRSGGSGCLDEIFWKLLDLGVLGKVEFDYQKVLELDKKQMIG